MRIFLRRKKFWLLGGAFLALVATLSVVAIKLRHDDDAYAHSMKDVTLIVGQKKKTTNYFSIVDEFGVKHDAWCVTPDKPTPGGGAKRADFYSLSELRNGRDSNGKDISNIQNAFVAYYYVKQNDSELFGNVEAMHWGLAALYKGWGRRDGENAGRVYDYGAERELYPFPENLESAEVIIVPMTDSSQAIFTARYKIKEETSIKVKKEWVGDDEWKDITRPETITYNLYQNGAPYRSGLTLSAANDWQAEVNNVPVGYTYTAIEVANDFVKGYKPTQDGLILTNELITKDIPVKKTWNGTNPGTSAKICLNRKRGNAAVEQLDDCVTLNAGNNWQGKFPSQPVYDKDGNEIVYSVREVEYDANRYVPEYSIEEDTFVVENNERARLKIVKVWKDNNDALSARPSSITVKIKRNDAEFQTITISDADAVTANRWEKSTDYFDVADGDGNRYTYTIEENVTVSCEGLSEEAKEVCEDYKPEYSQFNNGTTATITNSLNGETELYVVKNWKDESGVHEDRATRIYVDIYADDKLSGTKILCSENCSDVDNGDDSTVDVTVPDTDDTWTLLVKKLPKYDNNGKLITYTVDERLTAEDRYKYTTEIKELEEIPEDEEQHENAFSITNTREYSVDIEVTKEWIDNENAYDTRPKNGIVWFRLMRSHNGGEPEFVRWIQVRSSNNWTATVSGLPKYSAKASAEDIDIPYEYSVIEDNETYDWNSYYRDNGCELTDTVGEDDNKTKYSFTCENELYNEINLRGTKIWLDNGNAYNTRPASWNDFEVRLYRRLDGETYDTLLPIKPSWTAWPVLNVNGVEYDDVWEYVFEFLPEYVDGKKATYRATEIMPPASANGYKYCSIKSPIADDNPYMSDYANRLCGTVSFSGRKIWRYGTIPEELKPEDITIYLYRDGELYDQTTATALSEEETDEGIVWYFNFNKNYPKFDEYGRLYEYTFDEEAIEGFLTEWVDDDTVVNTYVMDVTVNKIWLNDDPSKRPGQIDVTLYRNGEVYDTIALNNDNDWSYTWEKLDSNYDYTVTENIQIPGYEEGAYTYKYDEFGNLIIDIYNSKIPDTSDKGISRYVFMISGMLLGGFAVSRKVFARR